MIDKKSKKQAKQFIDKNPIEAIKSIGGGIGDLIKKDVGRGVVSGLWKQMLGTGEFGAGSREKKGDLREGEELDLRGTKERQKEKQLLEIDPGIDYKREILYGEQRISKENGRETEVKIREIIIELKKLVATSKELQSEYRAITVEQLPQTPGKYHVNFFEWMVSILRAARMKVEDSASWLSLFKSKKAKKGYWSMFKKHGTSFGLSNERVVATQVG